MFLNSPICLRVSDEKAGFPSKACSTIPSRRSPTEMSLSSAVAFSTFNIRRSIRIPVCTRSTSTVLIVPRSVIMGKVYHGTLHDSVRTREGSEESRCSDEYLGDNWGFRGPVTLMRRGGFPLVRVQLLQNDQFG